MKKFLLALLAVGLCPASAMALPTQNAFAVSIVLGSFDVPVGYWYADLQQSLPGVCRYYVEWDNDAYLESSADLFLDEFKVHGASGCAYNAHRAVGTSIINAYDECSQGFDQLQQLIDVELLVCGEDVEDAEINCILKPSGASPGTKSLKAEPC